MRKKIALILIGSCSLFCVLQSGIDADEQSLSFMQKFMAQIITKSQQRLLSSPTSIVAPCLTREQEYHPSLFLELQKFVAQKNLKKLKIIVDSNTQENLNDCPVTPIVTPQGSLLDLSDCVVQSPRGKTPMNDSRELLRVISLVKSQSIRGCVVGTPEPESSGENLEEEDFGYFCDVEILSPSTRVRRRSSSSEGYGIRSFRSQNFDSANSLGSCCFASSSSTSLNDCPVPTPSPFSPDQR